jgi:hypothetical protein
MIFGFFITILTFPGVVMHEVAHEVACHIAGVRVLKVKYFDLSFKNRTAGYVEHTAPESYGAAFLICIAPIIFSNLAALALFMPAIRFDILPLRVLFAWLGISCAMHAFPSTGDARNLFRCSKASLWRNPLALLGFPVVGIIYLANFLSFFWLDFFWALFILFSTSALAHNFVLFESVWRMFP